MYSLPLLQSVGVWYSISTQFDLHYLHIFKHVTPPLSLHLIICQDKVQDIKGRCNYIHNLLFTKSIKIPSLSRQNDWFERGTDVNRSPSSSAMKLGPCAQIQKLLWKGASLVVKCQVLVCLVKDCVMLKFWSIFWMTERDHFQQLNVYAFNPFFK